MDHNQNNIVSKDQRVCRPLHHHLCCYCQQSFAIVIIIKPMILYSQAIVNMMLQLCAHVFQFNRIGCRHSESSISHTKVFVVTTGCDYRIIIIEKGVAHIFVQCCKPTTWLKYCSLIK